MKQHHQQDSCDIIDVCKNCSEHCSVLENCYDVCLPTVENSSTILKKHTPTFVFDTTESSDMKYEMQHVINKASFVEQRLYYVGDVQNISIDIPVPKPHQVAEVYEVLSTEKGFIVELNSVVEAIPRDVSADNNHFW